MSDRSRAYRKKTLWSKIKADTLRNIKDSQEMLEFVMKDLREMQEKLGICKTMADDLPDGNNTHRCYENGDQFAIHMLEQCHEIEHLNWDLEANVHDFISRSREAVRTLDVASNNMHPVKDVTDNIEGVVYSTNKDGVKNEAGIVVPDEVKRRLKRWLIDLDNERWLEALYWKTGENGDGERYRRRGDSRVTMMEYPEEERDKKIARFDFSQPVWHRWKGLCFVLNERGNDCLTVVTHKNEICHGQGTDYHYIRDTFDGEILRGQYYHKEDANKIDLEQSECMNDEFTTTEWDGWRMGQENYEEEWSSQIAIEEALEDMMSDISE